MINHSKQRALGYAGMALLRNWLVGNESTIESVFGEIASCSKLKNRVNDLEGKAKEYDIQDGYKVWSKTYDNEENILIQLEEPVVKGILEKMQIGTILDAGCGTGRYSLFLDSLGHTVTGIDISQDMLNLAKKKGGNIDLIQGDISKLPFGNAQFDHVVSGLAIHYVSDLKTTIREFSRVLKVGGKLVISSVHPWMVALGAHAEFHDKKEGWGYIQDKILWHSSYIEAYNQNSFKISECYEPKVGKDEVKVLHKYSDLSLETISEALEGLPVAIIWVLEKI